MVSARVDVNVIHKEMRLVCWEMADHRWKCAKCGRGVIARRFPGLLWSLEECRVCHSKVEVIDYGYPLPGFSRIFRRDVPW